MNRTSFENDIAKRLHALAEQAPNSPQRLIEVEQAPNSPQRSIETQPAQRSWYRLAAAAAVLIVAASVTAVLLRGGGQTSTEVATDAPIDTSAPTSELPTTQPPVEPETTQPPAETETNTSGVIGSEWTPLPEGPADGRTFPVSVWTGAELIVWGGEIQSETTWANDGAAYDPESRRWRALADSPLSPRSEHVAVWTGEEMIVCCGRAPGGDGGTSAAYDPVADSWRELAPPPFDAALAAAVWTGTEMIVTGGSNFNGVAAYDPATDAWSILASAPRKIERLPDVAWTGEQLIVWPRAFTNAPGLIYDRAANEWRQLPAPPAELAISQGSMVWTGTDIIMWGAVDSNESATVGARITLNGDEWQPIAEDPLDPFERWNGTDGASSAVWTGTEMLIWVGSIDNVSDLDDSTTATLAYNPTTDTWRQLDDVATTWHHPQMLWAGEVAFVFTDSTLVVVP